MSPIRHDETLMRLIRDVNEIKSALRRTVANLPLYDIANENTPTALSTDQNDYVPGNYDVLRLNATADVSITGFANGKKGRFLEIINVGTGRISFPDESTSSIAINRIATQYDQTVTLLPNARCRFYYDSTQERWTVADLPNIQGQFGKYAIISHSTQIVLDNVAAFSVTDVTPDTVTSDEWGYWDTTNKLFRIPTGESGLYSLVINYKWNNADTNDYTSNTLIYKNTSDLVGQAYSKMFGADNNNWPVLCMANFFAESGDEIDIRVQQSNGASATRDLLLIATGAPLICFSKIG